MGSKLIKSIRTCLHSTRRFETIRATREALHAIATLPVNDWQKLSSDIRVPEQALCGLITQCSCAIDALKWLESEDIRPKIQAVQEMIKNNERDGQDSSKAHTEPWRLYWGAWFLESKLPD